MTSHFRDNKVLALSASLCILLQTGQTGQIFPSLNLLYAHHYSSRYTIKCHSLRVGIKLSNGQECGWLVLQRHDCGARRARPGVLQSSFYCIPPCSVSPSLGGGSPFGNIQPTQADTAASSCRLFLPPLPAISFSLFFQKQKRFPPLRTPADKNGANYSFVSY